MPKKYYIEFDTNEVPGKIRATTIELGIEFVRDMDKPMSIDLSNHPLYPKLEAYVLGNPSARKAGKR